MGLIRDLKYLFRKSSVYGLGSFLVIGLNFLVLPLYTRYLTPEEFGIVYLSRAMVLILSIIISLGIHRSVVYFYHRTSDTEERRKTMGALWLFTLFVSVLIILILNGLGRTILPSLSHGALPSLFFQLSIWTAFFTTLGLLPLTLLQAKEQPDRYVVLTLIRTLLVIGITLKFIVWDDRGAYGYLWGALLASAIMLIPSVLFVMKDVVLQWKATILRPALGYSLPLVPHDLSGWVLEYSDRVILERFVSLDAIGVYSFGYQIASIMGNIAIAIKDAWLPFLFSTTQVQDKAYDPTLSRMVTYYVFALCWIGLGISLYSRSLLTLFVDPAYLASYPIILWVVAGRLCNGLYFIPVNFLFLKSKTIWIPVITLTSGICGIAMNLLLVPSYGIIAAAWVTLLSYAIMMIVAWFVAERIHPFPYEYKRILHVVFAFAGWLLLGNLMNFSSPYLELTIRSAVLVSFPAALIVTGFLLPNEKKYIGRIMKEVLTR